MNTELNESTRNTTMSETEKSRRDFMIKAGKLAVYTPPLVMLLMQPRTDAIAASTGLPDDSGDPPSGNPNNPPYDGGPTHPGPDNPGNPNNPVPAGPSGGDSGDNGPNGNAPGFSGGGPRNSAAGRKRKKPFWLWRWLTFGDWS